MDHSQICTLRTVNCAVCRLSGQSMDHRAKHGSTLCAEQSMDCANSYFAPNICTAQWCMIKYSLMPGGSFDVGDTIFKPCSVLDGYINTYIYIYTYACTYLESIFPLHQPSNGCQKEELDWVCTCLLSCPGITSSRTAFIKIEIQWYTNILYTYLYHLTPYIKGPPGIFIV